MDATHYRVIVKAIVTGALSYYTYTDATDAAHAARKAMAEATVDYGFLNVGLKVTYVQVWNFSNQCWDDVDYTAPVTVEEAAPVKAVEDMDDDEVNDEIRDMWAGSNGGTLPYFGFFGGGEASVKSKNYLRVLLAKNADRREAQLIRRVLNAAREEGRVIERADVLPAIKILKSI